MNLSTTRMSLLVCVGLIAASATAQPQTPYIPPASANLPAATANLSSADVAGRLIGDAQTSFSRIRDYAGLLYRQERLRGQMQPEQVIQFRIRQQPFSVSMKWLGPSKLAGQEAIYMAGKNNNQIKAKGAGPLLSAIGFMNFDPHDPKVTGGSKHVITDAGLGNMIEQMAKGHAVDRQQSAAQTVYQFGEYRFLNRPVTRMEAVHKNNTGQNYCYRTLVFFDRETKLPIRLEMYDWPRPGSPATGDLLECYSFVDLKFNIGLTDGAFGY